MLRDQDLDEDVQKALDAYSSTQDGVSDLVEHLAILTKTPMAGLRDRLSPTEWATLNASLAYTVASLYYISLKAQGRDPSTHPVMDKLAQVKAVIGKINSSTESSKRAREEAPAPSNKAPKHI